MPRYAVYETQRKMVVYFVDADNPDQAHDLVATMGVDDYDDLITVMDTDIDMSEMRVQKEDGRWEYIDGGEVR
jgi:hypothetical protein